MTTNIYIFDTKEPPVDKKEILRYMGQRGEIKSFLPLIDECLDIALPTLSYRAVFAYLPVCVEGAEVHLGELAVSSSSLARHLAACQEAVVFAATVGVGLDRLITKYSSLSVTRALALDAIGSERIEALCDTLCQKIKADAEERGLFTTSRFGQGYGDLPLEFNKKVFSLLDCPRRIGLCLNESLSMSPTKSVSAIVGLRRIKE